MFLKFLGIFVLVPGVLIILTQVASLPIRAAIAYVAFPILLLAAVIYHHVLRNPKP